MGKNCSAQRRSKRVGKENKQTNILHVQQTNNKCSSRVRRLQWLGNIDRMSEGGCVKRTHIEHGPDGRRPRKRWVEDVMRT